MKQGGVCSFSFLKLQDDWRSTDQRSVKFVVVFSLLLSAGCASRAAQRIYVSNSFGGVSVVHILFAGKRADPAPREGVDDCLSVETPTRW